MFSTIVGQIVTLLLADRKMYRPFYDPFNDPFDERGDYLHKIHDYFSLGTYCAPYTSLLKRSTRNWVADTWHLTLYTLHFTLYTLHFTLYTWHFTLYT